jgi:hypothetical protein
MAAKIRNAIVLYRRITASAGVEIRLHPTVLYNSIYRGDDELLVNQHVYAIAAAYAPVVHLRGTGGMVDTYVESFERVLVLRRAADVLKRQSLDRHPERERRSHRHARGRRVTHDDDLRSVEPLGEALETRPERRSSPNRYG